jgi:hypothetical protein
MSLILATMIAKTDWGQIGAIAGIVALPLAILVGWWQVRASRRREVGARLDYEKGISAALLTSLAKSTSALKIAVSSEKDGKQHRLSEPFLHVIRIINNGSKDIDATDFHGEKYRLKFDKPVLSANDVERSEGLQAEVDWKDNEAWLEPTLIKTGESVQISVLTDGPSDYSVEFRVKGIHPPVNIAAAQKVRSERPLMAGSLVGGLLIIATSSQLLTSDWLWLIHLISDGTGNAGYLSSDSPFFRGISVFYLCFGIWLSVESVNRLVGSRLFPHLPWTPLS